MFTQKHLVISYFVVRMLFEVYYRLQDKLLKLRIKCVIFTRFTCSFYWVWWVLSFETRVWNVLAACVSTCATQYMWMSEGLYCAKSVGGWLWDWVYWSSCRCSRPHSIKHLHKIGNLLVSQNVHSNSSVSIYVLNLIRNTCWNWDFVRIEVNLKVRKLKPILSSFKMKLGCLSTGETLSLLTSPSTRTPGQHRFCILCCF